MIEYSPNMYYITLNPIPLLQSNDGGLGTERGVPARIEQQGIGTDRRVRTYIISNHRYLESDISNGRGEYLSSLCSLLRLPQSDETIKKLQLISSRNPEAPSFAEALLSQYPVSSRWSRCLATRSEKQQKWALATPSCSILHWTSTALSFIPLPGCGCRPSSPNHLRLSYGICQAKVGKTL